MPVDAMDWLEVAGMEEYIHFWLQCDCLVRLRVRTKKGSVKEEFG